MTTALLSLLSATFGRNLGPSADWISHAFLVFAEADGAGAWYLIDDEETADALTLGYRASDDEAAFEVETTIPLAEVAAWIANELPTFRAKCVAISAPTPADLEAKGDILTAFIAEVSNIAHMGLMHGKDLGDPLAQVRWACDHLEAAFKASKK